MELIDKEKVVAEIKKLLDKYISVYTFNYGATQDLNHLLSFINTLEVKEVDLEQEKDEYWNKLCDDEFGELLERDAKWFDDIAKHFFELGLKARKGE